MPSLGLCCLFVSEPIKFKVTTAAHLLRLPRCEQLKKLSGLCRHNAQALLAAIEYCGAHHIGCFRVNSQFWPVKTHPKVGYDFTGLPGVDEIGKILSQCQKRAGQLRVRLSFHPDQFVLLNSPRKDVVASSIQELEYQAQVSQLIGADVINIHAGGGYGDKLAALKRMGLVLNQLKDEVRSRLTVENDDRVYTPSDLLPLCHEFKIPLVYDAHHHRCLPDGLSIEQATTAALKTWNREPLFHISSPREGWDGRQPRRHHDYINKKDFPDIWRSLNITVEVEAKAKELAVLRLYKDLRLSHEMVG